MGGNRGRRSLQPVSDEALNRKINSKLDRQRKKIESQVRCVQEILTSDAHPVVRNAVENKISALLGSPVVHQNSPLLSSEYAEKSVRTPPGMQRRMDMFKERIELHNNPSFLDISPTLIPTQNFLIKTGKKPPAPRLPPHMSSVDPLLSSSVDSDVSSWEDTNSSTSKRSIAENLSGPPAKRQRSSCDNFNANDLSADMFEDICFVKSHCNDSHRSQAGEPIGKLTEKRHFEDSKTDEVEYCNIDKENEPPSSEYESNKNLFPTFVSETNEFSFLNLGSLGSDSDEGANVSTEAIPDSLKVVHAMVGQNSDSNIVLADNCAPNSSRTSQRSSIEFNSQMSPVKPSTNIDRALTQKSTKRKAIKPNVACSQPLFSPKEDFDVFDESGRLSLPKKNKILLKRYPPVMTLSEASDCELKTKGVGCSQCHVWRVKETNTQSKESSLGSGLNYIQSNNSISKDESSSVTKQQAVESKKPLEFSSSNANSGIQACSNFEITGPLLPNGSRPKEQLISDSVFVSETGEEQSDDVAKPNKESCAKNGNIKNSETKERICNESVEHALRTRSRRSIWANEIVTVTQTSSNATKRVTRSQSATKSSERNRTQEEAKAKPVESNTKCAKPTAARKRKTVVGEPLIDSAIVSSESASSDFPQNGQKTREGIARKARNIKRDTSDPRILRDLSLPKKNVARSAANSKKEATDKRLGQPIVVRSSIDNCNYLPNKSGSKQRETKKTTRATSTAKITVTKLERSDSTTSNSPLTEIVISATAVSDEQKTLLASTLEALNDSSQSLWGSNDRSGRNVHATYKLSDKDLNWGLEGVTHVVCGKTNRRTLSVLFAIARGCWLLSFDWIKDSMMAGYWKLENEYELAEFPGAKINRERLNTLKVEALKKSKFRPNSNMPITIKPPRILPPTPLLYVLDNSQPEKYVLQYLISLTGGWIVENPLDAKFFIGPPESLKKIKVKSHQRAILMKVPVLKETWVLDYSFEDSISEGEQRNFHDYLGH